MRLIHTVLVTLLIAGCTGDLRQGSEVPGVIRIGVLPDQSMSRLLAQYTPLQQYLEDAVSLKFELVTSDSYNDMLDDFLAGRFDLANFGGLTFVQAESSSGAVPLVMRDTDLNFTSCFIAKSEQSGKSLADFKGQSFSFGPRLSTSGHLMPRRYLRVTGIEPESFFSSVTYSAGHDATVESIRDGTVALGAANCVIARSMLEDGNPDNDDIHIVATTPAYSNYVWVVQDDLSADLQVALRNAFMALDPAVAEHAEILRAVGARGYVPAGRTDFDDVRLAARDLGLLESSDAD